MNWTARSIPGPNSRRRFSTRTAKLDKKQRTREIFKIFAGRAYRRPATDDEVERLAKLVERFENQGDKWEAAMQIGFQAVLCSPKFLFRVELDHRPDSADPHPLDDYQLASRLSYFLWSTMPDDELFALAEKKQLHQNLDNAGAADAARIAAPTLWSTTSACNGCNCGTSKLSPPIPRPFPIGTNRSGSRCSRRPSCSCKRSCARTAAFST